MFVELDRDEIQLILDALEIAYEDHDNYLEGMSLREKLNPENHNAVPLEEFVNIKLSQYADAMGVPKIVIDHELQFIPARLDYPSGKTKS